MNPSDRTKFGGLSALTAAALYLLQPPLVAQSPSPPGSGTPPPAMPTPTAAPQVAPVEPPAGTPTAPPPLIFPVLPPQPAPALPDPPPAPPATVVVGGRDDGRAQRAIPRIRIWRTGSNAPQILPRGRSAQPRALVTGSEPVRLVLSFHPLMAGQHLAINTSPEISVTPAGGIEIGSDGQCTAWVQLADDATRGAVSFYTNGVATAVQFARRSEAMVARAEQQDEGGAE